MIKENIFIKAPDSLDTEITAKDAAKMWGDTDAKSDRFDEKFEAVPSEFTVYGVMSVTVKFKGEDGADVVREGVPAFAINPDGSKYILLSTIMANYFSDSSKSDFVPTQITKEGDNTGKYLIVNNRQVCSFTEGKSVNEITAYMLNKRYFGSKPGKIFFKYSPKFIDGKPQFAPKDLQGEMLKDELAKRVFAKKYVEIYAKE